MGAVRQLALQSPWGAKEWFVRKMLERNVPREFLLSNDCSMVTELRQGYKHMGTVKTRLG